MPWVAPMVTVALALFCTAGLPREVATAVRLRPPATAKVMAPTLMGTICDAPGARLTALVPRLATTAAGPPRLRSKVSCAWPVFRTVIWKVLPGPALGGVRATLTPLPTIVRVPVARLCTAGLVVDTALTVKPGLPGRVPGEGVRWSLTWRKLLSPGGACTVVWSNTPLTPAGRVAEGG